MCGSLDNDRAYSPAFDGNGSLIASASIRRSVSALAAVYPGMDVGAWARAIAMANPQAVMKRLRGVNGEGPVVMERRSSDDCR
jgi:hypothetical protein